MQPGEAIKVIIKQQIAWGEWLRYFLVVGASRHLSFTREHRQIWPFY